MLADLSVFKPKKDKGKLEIRKSATGMLALAWMDRRQVSLLSTMHRGREMVELPPNFRGEERTKPLAVHEYNCCSSPLVYLRRVLSG